MPTAAYRSGYVAPMMAAAAPAGRQARDVYALRIDRMVPHDLAGDAGDQRGFAPAAALGRPCRNQFQHFAWLAPLGCSG